MPKFATREDIFCKVVKQGEGEVSDLPLKKQWAQSNCRIKKKEAGMGNVGKAIGKGGDYPAQA